MNATTYRNAPELLALCQIGADADEILVYRSANGERHDPAVDALATAAACADALAFLEGRGVGRP